MAIAQCGAAGFSPEIVARVDDVGAVIGLVARGFGVALLPEATRDPAEGAVARVHLSGRPVLRHTMLVSREGEQRLPRIAETLTAIENAARAYFGA